MHQGGCLRRWQARRGGSIGVVGVHQARCVRWLQRWRWGGHPDSVLTVDLVSNNIMTLKMYKNKKFDWLIGVFFSEAILYKPQTLLRWANYESTLEEMVFVLNLLLVFLFGFSSSSLALLLKALLRPQYSRVKEQPLCSFIMMFSVQLFGCVCMVFLFLLLL